jgi:hypothetical protein
MARNVYVTVMEPVGSVNGKIGNVVLNKSDIGLGNVDNTADADKSVALAQKVATLVTPLSIGTTLTDSHNGSTLILTSTPLLTINTGLPSGFGCAIKGSFTYTGTATVADVRNTGVTNPWCALIQTGTDTYDLVGGKI